MRATSVSLELLRRFGLDRHGSTAIEYALIAGGVSIAIVAVVLQIGDTLKTLYFEKIAGAF